MMIRSYSGLLCYKSFEQRYRYLHLRGDVGAQTFGFDRYLNQRFYTSREWKQARDFVIARDFGCDLGIQDRQVYGKLVIHHMNPLTLDDFSQGNDSMLNPDFLVVTSLSTHNAIHFGDESLLASAPVVRTPGDTQLWRR